MTTRTIPLSLRLLRLAVVLGSLSLWAACSDDGGGDEPDARALDARVADAAPARPDAATDAAAGPECRTPDDCSDGVFCNGEEACTDGSCEPAIIAACDDRVACTVDICDESGRRCRNNADHGLCSNGLFCDGAETCSAAGCVDGPPPALADGVQCRNGRITAGAAHTCALLNGGAVYCWGRSDLGQTGHGNTTVFGDTEPASAGGALAFGGQVVVDVEAGDLHTCALLASGNVRCWGFGGNGRLGYGNTANLGDGPGETPASLPDVDLGGVAVQIAAGGSHTCALLADGAVRCWGLNADGQLGYGNVVNVGDDETPASVDPVDLGRAAVEIAAGGSHTCALLQGGSVRCWGSPAFGQLGNGSTTIKIGDNETPAAVDPVDVGGTVTRIAAGTSHTCAVLDGGAVRCWGRGLSGQLGYGSASNVLTPSAAGDVPVGGAVTDLALGDGHTCARLAGGAVRCWGRGDHGQLGNADTANLGDDEVLMLSDIDLGATAAHLSAGADHNCALLASGQVRCWGNAGLGRLGHGDLFDIGDDETPTSAGDVPLP